MDPGSGIRVPSNLGSWSLDPSFFPGWPVVLSSQLHPAIGDELGAQAGRVERHAVLRTAVAHANEEARSVVAAQALHLAIEGHLELAEDISVRGREYRRPTVEACLVVQRARRSEQRAHEQRGERTAESATHVAGALQLTLVVIDARLRAGWAKE